MTTFPVDLPSGAQIQIGGEPIGNDEKIKRLFPELWENVISKDVFNLPDNAALENFCFYIAKHFNQNVQADTFCVDHYSARQIIKIWYGQAEHDGKKKGHNAI